MKNRKDVKRILKAMLATLVALLLVFQLAPVQAFADNTDGDSAESSGEEGESTEIDLDAMQSELDKIDQEMDAAQAEMDALNARVQEKEQEVGRINDEVEQKQDAIQRKQDEIEMQAKKIEKQQESIEEQYEGLGNRLRTMYKNGSIGFIDVLLGSSSFSEFMSNLEMVQLIYEHDKATLEDLHEHYGKMKEALDELAAMQEQLTQAKDELLAEKDNALAAQAELSEVMNVVHEKIHELEEQSRSLSGTIYAEQQRIEAELEKAREEARLKAQAEAEEAARRKAEEEEKRAAEIAAAKEQVAELDAEAEEIEALISDKQAEVDAASEEVANKQAEIDAVQEEIDNAGEEADTTALEETKAALEAEKAELDAVLAALQAELDELEAQLAANRAARDEIYATLPEESDGGGDGSSYVDPITYTGGLLSWPVYGGFISSYFGPRPPEATDGIGSTNHGAIDIAVPSGTPVYAAESGVVMQPSGMSDDGWYYGYGYAVLIYHGEGVSTLYGHNSSLVVSPGEYVSRGQLIAYAGSTGWSTGPHVHFEVRIDGVQVDPLNYLP